MEITSGMSSLDLQQVQQSGGRPKDDPEKIVKAAHQFEALLIGQMVKSMQPEDGGWLGGSEDNSSSAVMEYGQEAFAQALSSKGGLGLADLVAKGLNR